MPMDGQELRHFFVTDKALVIEFHPGRIPSAVSIPLPQKAVAKEEAPAEEPGVRIHEYTFSADAVRVVKEFRSTKEIKERMSRVCGARAFSFCLRNSEHMAKYITSGSWVSSDMFPNAVLIRLFGRALGPKERALINMLPKELGKEHVVRPLFPDIQ